MAIKLDGTQIVNKTSPAKVTYNPPAKPAATSQPNYYLQYVEAQKRQQQQAAAQAAAQRAQMQEQQRRQEQQRQAQIAAYQKAQQQQQAYAQRMQAQADQAMKAQQAAQQSMNRHPVTNNLVPTPLNQQQVNVPPSPNAAQNMMNSWYGASMNMGPSQQSQNAYAQRYMQQAQQYGQQNASPTKPYHPVTNPTGYKSGMDYVRSLPMDWREQNANILMTPNEWLRRRNAWEKQYGNIFVSESEWQKRNAAAPPGYMWTPFGTGYAKLDTSSQTTAPTNPGYGDGGDYGDWGNWGDGGGGGGSGYTPQPPEWWVEMVNWRI